MTSLARRALPGLALVLSSACGSPPEPPLQYTPPATREFLTQQRVEAPPAVVWNRLIRGLAALDFRLQKLDAEAGTLTARSPALDPAAGWIDCGEGRPSLRRGGTVEHRPLSLRARADLQVGPWEAGTLVSVSIHYDILHHFEALPAAGPVQRRTYRARFTSTEPSRPEPLGVPVCAASGALEERLLELASTPVQ